MALTDTLRIETVSADKRHVEATMPIVPEVFQPHGYLHGGATIALLETVASIGTEQNTDFDKEVPFKTACSLAEIERTSWLAM